MRGTVLHYAGRLREAEQSFCDTIEKGQIQPERDPADGVNQVSGTFCCISGGLPEANAAFEASNKSAPRYAGKRPECGSAGKFCFAQGQQPQRGVVFAVDNALKLP